MRILLTIILLTVGSWSIALGQGSNISFSESPYSTKSDDPLATWTPPIPAELADITDSLSNYTVGQESEHQVGFKLPPKRDECGGWLRGRYVVMTFPPQFDLFSIDSVSYHDTNGDCQDNNDEDDDEEDHHCDPEIEAVYVYSQSVSVRFKRKFPGPHGPDYAYLTVYGVGNATVAKDYEVLVRIDNSGGRAVAGPNSSEPFYLVPDVPVEIGIIPSEDMSVTTGTLIPFSAAMVDQYGNQVSELDVDWGIDPTHDPIGSTTGPLFLATTVGVGRVTASAGELTGYSGFITVTAGQLSSLEISWPGEIRAGQSFEFQVTNALDQSGGLFTGRLLLHGGEIAPDGTEPFLSAINITQGQGSSPAVLYFAGDNDIRLEVGDFDSTITPSVVPGQLASIELEIGETQFLGHDFVDDPAVSAFDPYKNYKIDFSETGLDLSISTDEGQILPDLIPADAFISGVAALSGYRYIGLAGSHLLTISTVNQQDSIFASTEIFANGITFIFDEEDPLPRTLYEHWEFSIRGQLVNFGNLAPTELRHTVNIVGDGNGYPVSVDGKDCLPQPFDPNGCSFLVQDSAYMPAGEYELSLFVSATYEHNGEEIVVHQLIGQSLEILPFEKLRVELVNPPEIGYATDYYLPFKYSLINENDFDEVIRLDLVFYVTDGEGDFLHRRTAIYEYNWPEVVNDTIQFRFSENIPVGVYTYGVMITGRVYEEGSNSRIRINFHQQIDLGDSLRIVPQASFAIDPNSFTPKIVNGGISVPFSFDLEVDTKTKVILRGHKTKLTLTNSGVNSSAYLSEENYLIESGTVQLTTQPLFIPSSWHGKPLTAILSLVGVEGGFVTIAEDILFNPGLTVIAPAGMDIVSLDAVSPNAPYVNTNQQFSITGKIVNGSHEDLVGPILVSLISDGASSSPLSIVIPSIPAGDTANVEFDVTASSTPNPAEQFHLDISVAGITVNDGPHNNVVVVIQTPAELTIEAEIVGHLGEFALIDYEEQFVISATAINLGQGGYSGGVLHLSYNGPGDFQIRPIELDSLYQWSLISPAENIESHFTISWMEYPIDINRSEPVVMPGEPVELPFMVRASTTQLILLADGFNSQPLQRGVESRLFDLTFENITSDSRNIVGLNSLAIGLTDRDGNIIPAELLTDVEGSNFYLNGSPVATPSIRNGQLYYHFSPLVIQPGAIVSIEYRLKPHSDLSIEFFDMRLTEENFSAEFIFGPRTGQAVPVSGLLDRAFNVNIPQAIISEEFASSFKNYPNPFNPNVEATELRYFLSEDSDVDIYIYTQTGEKVRQFSFSAGSNGGRAGINSGIYWDGSNGNGDDVLNGVYIALIEVAKSGLTAKLKLAVVK